jgi:hypothetical protein
MWEGQMHDEDWRLHRETYDIYNWNGNGGKEHAIQSSTFSS